MKTAIDVRPYQVMCLICRLGKEDNSNYYFDEALDVLQKAVKADLNQPLALCCNVESTFDFQNPGKELDTPEGELFNLRRDLTILQRLGLTPGGVYPASDLIRLFMNELKDCQDVCGAPDLAVEQWKGCKFAHSGNYERGLKDAIKKLTTIRSDVELTASKQESAPKMYEHKMLEIRPHHLLCMTCFANGKPIEDLKAIEEDHLYEALEICQKNPNIPIKLVAGPCMICEPCFGLDPCSGTCSAAFGMGLRDQKKDLDTLRLLGLEYGDILPAVELYNLIFDRIENLTAICGFTTAHRTGPAWSVCSGENDLNGRNSFHQAKSCGFHIPGVIKRPE
jgi:hypothetical protein